MNPSDSMHRQTWDLIPWMVNQTASTEERERAMAHLASCADCRDELALQERIHAGMHAGPVADGVDARSSLRNLLDRMDADRRDGIDADTPRGDALPRPPRSGRSRGRWLAGLAAAVLVQAIGLITLGALLMERNTSGDPAAAYATLSSGAAPAGSATIRLVPSPTLSVGGLQALLDATGLQIVGSNAGATILALAPVESGGDGEDASRRTSDAIQRLRKGPGILLAEPILVPAPAQ